MKVRVVVILEYELHPENYPGTDDPTIMIARDIESLQENPDYLAEVIVESSPQISGTLVKE